MSNPFYELPPDLAADIDAYEGEVQRFLSRKLSAATLKAKRVPRGIYEQRQDGTYLVRARVPAGVLTNAQAHTLSQLSREFGDGMLHLTTRQGVQIHNVSLEDTPEILRRLLQAGLTTKGSGGNTVRNITTCPYAGVCPQECFDISEFAQSITQYMIKLVGSYNLPRKYKIALSGCNADCGLAQVSDLGLIAEIRNAQPGFRVFAGGGMGAYSRIASLLLEWTPAQNTLRVAEAVRRLLDRHGDRRNRNRARLRFVLDRIGDNEFRKLFNEELGRVAESGVPQLQGPSILNRHQPTKQSGFTLSQGSSGFRYLAQRQEGLVAIPFHPQMGLVTSENLVDLAQLATRFSTDPGLWIARGQEIQIRFVRTHDLPEICSELLRLKIDFANSATSKQLFISCAGADACRLGLCSSRKAVIACEEALETAGLDGKTLDGLAVRVNGCPNACGHDPVAPIGLSGAAKRVDGYLVPSYRVTLGGRCDSRGARLGSLLGQIPAKRLPSFVTELARDFAQNSVRGELFSDFFDRRGQAHFSDILDRHSDVPRFQNRPDFYKDFGSDEFFSLAGRGAGECGAGVFELIQEELTAAGKAINPFETLLASCRSLLITRGIDSTEADTIFRSFEEHFINTGLVGEEFRTLLLRARSHAQGWKEALQNVDGEPGRLLNRVKLLYSTLDSNLEFHPPERESSDSHSAVTPNSETTASARIYELDLRGVACPMNFVKAKLKLESIQTGEALEIVLDDGPPIQNVPASFRAEGQQVENMFETADGHWKVTVRKTWAAPTA